MRKDFGHGGSGLSTAELSLVGRPLPHHGSLAISSILFISEEEESFVCDICARTPPPHPPPLPLRWDLGGQGMRWRETGEGKGGSYFLLIYLFSSFLPQVAMVIPSSLSLPSRGDGYPLREQPSVPTAPAAAFPHQRLNIPGTHHPLSV